MGKQGSCADVVYVTYPTLIRNLHPPSPLMSDVEHPLAYDLISVAHPPTHLPSPLLVNSRYLQERL